VTIIEVYCDGCDLPAPTHASMGGAGERQRVRELLPKYRQRLRELGWVRTDSGHDLCDTCKIQQIHKTLPLVPYWQDDGGPKPGEPPPADPQATPTREAYAYEPNC
jgi:hypothetical protein